MSKKNALIVGATGLIGKALVRLLLDKDYYEKIIVIARRELVIKDNRLHVIILDDFEKIGELGSQIDAHDYYCALGTTRKKAGSKEAFLKIDVDYSLMLAKAAMKQKNFEQFMMVTSLGANSDSPLFYNMAKGKLEDELVKLDMKSLKIFQPSLLIGYRDDFRLGEEIGKFISSLLSFFAIGSKNRLWSIRGDEVAMAMFKEAQEERAGVTRYKPDRMIKIAYS
jgi:uncharacterized protein YbjT (DUF2867 family)